MLPLVSTGLGLVSTFLQGRQKVSAAKAEAKVVRLTTGIPGYSDEFLVFVWMAPLVMTFVPPLQPYAAKGFALMAELPDWYVGMVGTITLSVFGVDKLLSWKQK